MNEEMSTTKEKEVIWEEKNLIEPEKNCLNNKEIEQKDITNIIKTDLIKKACNDTGQENVYYVYHLIDPKTNTPFYIGKGKDDRMYHHEADVKNDKMPHNNKLLYYKIKKVLKESGKIEYVKIKENINESSSFILETIEIKKYGRKDSKTGILCNLTDGGEGQSGWRASESHRKNMSKKTSGILNGMYGKKHSIETIEKIRRKNLGKKYSVEFCKKRSEMYKGKSNPFYGKKHTDEIKRKLSNINKNRPKELHPMYGKRHSESTKKKMSENRKCIPKNLHGRYINLDNYKESMIEIYQTTKQIIPIKKFLSEQNIIVSFNSIRRRMIEWNVI